MKVDELRKILDEEKKNLKNDKEFQNQKELYASTGISMRNTVKAHLIFVLAIVIQITTAFALVFAFALFSFLATRYIPTIYEWYLKIDNFFEFGLASILISALYIKYFIDFIARSIEYHPSRKGYRFIVWAIINIIVSIVAIKLGITKLTSLENIKFSDAYIVNTILFLGESCVFFSYYTFRFYFDNRGSAYLIGEYVKDAKSDKVVFVPVCYFYANTVSTHETKDRLEKLSIRLVRNVVYSCQKHFNLNKLSGYLYLLPGKIKNNQFICTEDFLIIDLDKELCQGMANDSSVTFNLNNYPRVKEMHLFWIY